MGWSNYLYSEKFKLAIEIGKVDYNDLDEDGLWDNFEEFIGCYILQFAFALLMNFVMRALLLRNWFKSCRHFFPLLIILKIIFIYFKI